MTEHSLRNQGDHSHNHKEYNYTNNITYTIHKVCIQKHIVGSHSLFASSSLPSYPPSTSNHTWSVVSHSVIGTKVMKGLVGDIVVDTTGANSNNIKYGHSSAIPSTSSTTVSSRRRHLGAEQQQQSGFSTGTFSQQFGVLTYNVWNFNNGPEWKQRRLYQVAQVIRDSRADLIGLQEIRHNFGP